MEVVRDGIGARYAYHGSVAVVRDVAAYPFACVGARARYTRSAGLARVVVGVAVVSGQITVAYPLEGTGEAAAQRALDPRVTRALIG